MADNINGIPFSSDDEGRDFPSLAKRLVQDQYNIVGLGTKRGEPIIEISIQEIYIVWFAFVLGNWKAVLSTSRPDGTIYEVTYNKDKNEWYVDRYVKTHNIVVGGY